MPLSRQFDGVFRTHGQGIPVAYLRALSMRESSMNPGSKGVSAWGLLQITEVVRRDYNSRNNTSWERESLLRADICTMIACDLLRRIVTAYERNHGTVGNMSENWFNQEFVELLTFGWNAGYSEAGGVGRVVRFLVGEGARTVTIDTVHAAAARAGASSTLHSAAKRDWCKSVAELYMSEPADDSDEPIFDPDNPDDNPPSGGGGGALVVALAAGAVLIGI